MATLQNEANRSDDLSGQLLLGRYRVVREIGRGGMGRVYLAEQRMGNVSRKVAVKTLLPEHRDDPSLVSRFYRESETVVRLSHPNTIQFYDFGDLDDGTLLIIMEYIDGMSLGQALESGPLSPLRIDRLLLQIAGSLHEAHSLGVLHRDLKPENIMLTRRGGQDDFVKVLDFGIAKHLESAAGAFEQAALTHAGAIIGTPMYMAPEQFRSVELTPACDIYALGVLTYEMLTAHLPFEATTPFEWASAHMTAAPIPLEQALPGLGLDPAREAALFRALEKDPEARFSDVIAFVSAFAGVSEMGEALALSAVGKVRRSRSSASGMNAAPAAGAPETGENSEAISGEKERSSLSSGGGRAVGNAPEDSAHIAPMREALDEEDEESWDTVAAAAGLPAKRGGVGLVLVTLLLVLAASGVWAWQKSRENTAHDPREVASAKSTTLSEPPASGGADAENSAADDAPDGARVPRQGEAEATATNARESAAGAETPVPRDVQPKAPARRAARSARAAAPTSTNTRTAAVGDRAATSSPARPSASTTPETAPSAAEPRDAGAEQNLENQAIVNAAAARGEAAIRRGDVRAALRELAILERYPEGQGQARQARELMRGPGPGLVGMLILRGKCKDAQALYTELRAMGAEGSSGSHFIPGICPRP